MYNTKLQGRPRIRRTHNYTWHRRQKQLNPIVTVGNKITKAVRSDKAEFRTRKTRPQPVPMSDIRGLRQQVWKEPGLLDVRYKTPASLITARQKCRQATAHECRLIRAIWKNYSKCRLHWRCINHNYFKISDNFSFFKIKIQDLPRVFC